MVKLTVDQVVSKWSANTQNATGYMKDGVNAVSVNPMEQAAQQLPKALQNYQQAINSGRMASAMRGVSLSDWQNAMINKGVPRVAQGVTNAVPKTTAAFNKLLPYIQKGQDIVSKMPSTTLQDSKNRMSAFFDHMAAYKTA